MSGYTEHKGAEAHTGAPGAVRVEADRPPIRVLWFVLVGLAVVVVASVVGVTQLFKVAGDEHVREANLSVANDALQALRARDHEAATTYGLLDEATGRYRIPVERAAERLLANPKLIGPLAEPPKPGSTGGVEGAGGANQR